MTSLPALVYEEGFHESFKSNQLVCDHSRKHGLLDRHFSWFKRRFHHGLRLRFVSLGGAMSTEKTLNVDVEIGKCGEGHFRAHVVFKDDDGKVVHDTISPCFDTQAACEKATDFFIKKLAPVIIAGMEALKRPDFEPDPEIDPAQYLH